VHNTIIAILLAFSIGGHWAVLQSMAWMGMIVSYSQKSGVMTGIKKTFDGNHPCDLCKLVSKAKSEQKTQDVTQVQAKLDFFLVNQLEFVAKPMPRALLPHFPAIAELLFEVPPIPPPRFV
jgi:hypothetical protein